ncbi:MAG: hypothetical protein LBF26_00150, partial [Puniceicoccales bacterium]|nr:hypothetical protein [Puniceicoccales bacterium]
MKLLAIGLLAIWLPIILCGADDEDCFLITNYNGPVSFIVVDSGTSGYFSDQTKPYKFSHDANSVIRFDSQSVMVIYSNGGPIECIKFVSETTDNDRVVVNGNYAGKTVSIVGNTSINPIISVIGNTYAADGNKGAFVSFNEVNGAEHQPFTLKLSVASSGTAEFWDTSQYEATKDHFCGFGAPDADGTSAYISIVPSETIPMSVVIANNAWSTAFGTVSCSGQSGTFENFYVGPIAPDSTFAAGTIFGTCTALSGTDFNANVLTLTSGAACSNNFSNVTIGGIGANSTLTAKQSVFGGGYVARGAEYGCSGNLAKWTIGPIGNNVSLTTVASSGGTGRSACVFGAAHTGSGARLTNSPLIDGAIGNCDQWTAEFQGSATVTAMAPYANKWTQDRISNSYEGDTIIARRNLISTLGGEQNSNMRFYFNDLAASSSATGPSVVISALRLQLSAGPWNVSSITLGMATATLDPSQEAADMNAREGYSLAVSMGPNFQLNVGRKRSMVADWNELAQGGQKGSTENGTWETDASVASGGRTYVIEGDNIRRIGPGTLSIIGGIAKASKNTSTEGAILRINNGWEVNCFGYVKDLEGGISVRGNFEKDSALNFYGPVEIPSGATVTIGNRGAINLHRQSGVCETFDSAFAQIVSEAAFYADASSTSSAFPGNTSGGTHLAVTDSRIGLYQTDNGGRAFARKGSLKINRTSAEVNFGDGAITKMNGDLQSKGTMAVGNGSRIYFAGGEHGGYLQLNDDGSSSGKQLTIGTDVKFSLLDTNHTVPNVFDYWIVRLPPGTTVDKMTTLIEGLTMGDLADKQIQNSDGSVLAWGSNYYNVTYVGADATSTLLDLDDTAYEPKLKRGEIKLLWSANSDRPGIFVVGRAPMSREVASILLADREFLSELAEEIEEDLEFRKLIKGDKGDP